MRQNSLILPGLTVATYALGYPLGSMTLHFISPFLLILLRFAASSVLLWTIVALRRIPLPRGKALLLCATAGLLTQGVQFLGLYWGLAHGLSAAIGALVIAMNPVATAVIGRIVLGKRETAWGLVALACGTGAVVLACLPKVVANPALGGGLVTSLAALGGLAAGSILQAERCSSVDATAFTAIAVTASVPFSGIACLTAPQHLTSPSHAVPLLAALVVDSTVAVTLYASVVRGKGARPASILFAVIPAIAALLAWALQGDTPNLTVLGALLLGAVAVAAQSRTKTTAPKDTWRHPVPETS